jgi:hypothetical protein
MRTIREFVPSLLAALTVAQSAAKIAAPTEPRSCFPCCAETLSACYVAASFILEVLVSIVAPEKACRSVTCLLKNDSQYCLVRREFSLGEGIFSAPVSKMLDDPRWMTMFPNLKTVWACEGHSEDCVTALKVWATESAPPDAANAIDVAAKEFRKKRENKYRKMRPPPRYEPSGPSVVQKIVWLRRGQALEPSIAAPFQPSLSPGVPSRGPRDDCRS